MRLMANRAGSTALAMLGLIVAACSVNPGVSAIESKQVAVPTTAASSSDTTASTPEPSPSAPTTGSAGTSPTTSLPAEPLASDVEFGSCESFVRRDTEPPGDGWECGYLTVALDPADPDGDAIELAVTRRPGSRSRGDALVFNPGGPGGAGLPFVWQTADRLPADVLRLFDIVSWDPRGVGVSVPAITCPRAARWEDPDLLARCAEATGPLLEHISTANHVDDLDRIRQALANERLNYVGYSYGTYLGARYAARFPERVGRFVLDGAVDPASGTSSAPRIDGFPWYAADEGSTVEDRFFALCDAAAACELGPDSASRYRELLGRIGDLPTDAYPGEERVDAPTLAAVVSTSMLDPFNWGLLSTALEDAAAGDASTVDALADLLQVSNAYFGEYVDVRDDNEDIANLAIYCADFEGVEQVPDYCSGLPSNGAPTRGVEAVDVDVPVVVIGTALDPSTPGRHADELAGRLGDARVVHWDGIGHTAFPLRSLCIDDAVTAYLLDGVLPADGLRCEFVAGVQGDTALAEFLFALPPTYVQPWIEAELFDAWGIRAACGAERLSTGGDRLVTHLVLGLDNDGTALAIDKAAASCR